MPLVKQLLSFQFLTLSGTISISFDFYHKHKHEHAAMKAEGFSVDDRKLVENYGYGSSNYSPNYGYGSVSGRNYGTNYGYGSASNYGTNYGYGSSNYGTNYGIAKNYGVTGGTRRLMGTLYGGTNTMLDKIRSMVRTIKARLEGTESGPITVKVEEPADNYG